MLKNCELCRVGEQTLESTGLLAARNVTSHGSDTSASFPLDTEALVKGFQGNIKCFFNSAIDCFSFTSGATSNQHNVRLNREVGLRLQILPDREG